MRYRLKGNWTKGLAFDLHTLASVYLGDNAHGHPQFDNKRSEMGELVWRLKYRGEGAAVDRIVSLLEPIQGIESFDAIIPVPSSAKGRAVRPADAIAEALGKQRGVRVLQGYLAKLGSDELKEVDDPAERERILQEQVVLSGKEDISGKKVLLLDDVYRSGTTLNVCCDLLKRQAKAGDVSVLTMTKARAKR